jgi:hypothetical protein
VDYTNNNAGHAIERFDRRRHAGGVYDLPFIGGSLSSVRNFYEDMAPQPDDATEVKLAKEIVRYGSVVVAAAAAATVVF